MRGSVRRVIMSAIMSSAIFDVPCSSLLMHLVQRAVHEPGEQAFKIDAAVAQHASQIADRADTPRDSPGCRSHGT